MAELSPAESVFAMRMLPHIEAGKSFEDAARAVLQDDQRLYSALMDRGHSQYVPTPDERGKAWHTGERPGDVIVRELADITYRRIRGERA